MRPIVLLLLPCAFLCILRPAFSQQHSKTVSPRVVIESGTLEGAHFGSSQDDAAFLGVPYAAPPIAGLRWKPPQPAKNWPGTRQATQFGAACPQLPAQWFPYIGWNEDCLFLNVWTPQLHAKSALPVIVYFHGGSNTQGYSQMTPLGPPLSRYGVLVVSANYRLGPFGFLAHPALTAESDHHSSGNYGLLDQLQALRWVQANIARFGGDPKQVTVMGQSAGAVDACLLLTSPLATGLFQRAIMESGECQSTLNEDIRRPLDYNQISGTGEASGERLARDLGVAADPDTLLNLRNIPAEEILKAWSHDRELHFDAIVDGWVVPEQPAAIFAKRKQLPIPVLVGSNADEATVFGHGVKTLEEYKNYLRRDTGKFFDSEFKAYPATSGAEVAARYLQLQSDLFAYGAYSLAQHMTQSSHPAYLYLFAYADTGKRAALGAHHGEELFFLADSFPPNWERTPDDRQFADTLRTYWTQFAKTGNPNLPGYSPWDAYADNQTFELGRHIGNSVVSSRLSILGSIMNQIQTAVSAGERSESSAQAMTRR